MRSILVDFGTWRLPLFGEQHLFLASYGLIFALTALAGWIVFIRLARLNGIPQHEVETVAFWTLIAALVGSKLTLVLLDLRYYLEDPARIFGTLRSAGVLMGGVAAGFAVMAFLALRRGLPFWKMADAVAVPLPVGQAFGRIGCLMAGCCYGRPAPGLPWAITFTDPAASENGGAPLNVPLHPVQIYHFGADLLVFALVAIVWRRRRFDGQVMLAYLILYSIDRAIVEVWRGDVVRGLFFGGWVSTSQIFSAIGLAAAVALWPYLSHRQIEATAPG